MCLPQTPTNKSYNPCLLLWLVLLLCSGSCPVSDCARWVPDTNRKCGRLKLRINHLVHHQSQNKQKRGSIIIPYFLPASTSSLSDPPPNGKQRNNRRIFVTYSSVKLRINSVLNSVPGMYLLHIIILPSSYCWLCGRNDASTLQVAVCGLAGIVASCCGWSQFFKMKFATHIIYIVKYSLVENWSIYHISIPQSAHHHTQPPAPEARINL